jgi:hypothetical protein
MPLWLRGSFGHRRRERQGAEIARHNVLHVALKVRAKIPMRPRAGGAPQSGAGPPHPVHSDVSLWPPGPVHSIRPPQSPFPITAFRRPQRSIANPIP